MDDIYSICFVCPQGIGLSYSRKLSFMSHLFKQGWQKQRNDSNILDVYDGGGIAVHVYHQDGLLPRRKQLLESLDLIVVPSGSAYCLITYELRQVLPQSFPIESIENIRKIKGLLDKNNYSTTIRDDRELMPYLYQHVQRYFGLRR